MLIPIHNGRRFINPEHIKDVEIYREEDPKEYDVVIGNKTYIVNQEVFDAIIEFHNPKAAVDKKHDIINDILNTEPIPKSIDDIRRKCGLPELSSDTSGYQRVYKTFRFDSHVDFYAWIRSMLPSCSRCKQEDTLDIVECSNKECATYQFKRSVLDRELHFEKPEEKELAKKFLGRTAAP